MPFAPEPAEAEFDLPYDGTDIEALTVAPRYHRWILEQAEPYLGDRVIEVGAGRGTLSEFLVQRAGHTVHVEPSASNRAHLQARIDGAIRAGRAQVVAGTLAHYQSSGEPATAALYVNVLEHIADDVGELALAASLVAPGGHVVVFSPALPWLYSHHDAHVGHVRRYTKQGLRDVVHGAGLELRVLHYMDLLGVAPWFVLQRLLGRTIGGTDLDQRMVRLYDTLVVPVMRVVEGWIAPPIGKNLLAIGRVRA